MLKRPLLTKDNIEEYIEQGYVYEANTPSGWGMLILDENVKNIKCIDKDDLEDYTKVVDMPEVQPLLDEIKKEQEESKKQFMSRFNEVTKDLFCLHDVSRFPYEIREKYDLFMKDSNESFKSEYGQGLWYHGITEVEIDKRGFVHVTYGGSYDLYATKEIYDLVIKELNK